MQIYLRTLVGKPHPLEVEATDTIATVKSQVATTYDIPSSFQRMIFAGKELDDSRTLHDYYILKECSISLVLRPGFTHAVVLDSKVMKDITTPGSCGLWVALAMRDAYDCGACDSPESDIDPIRFYASSTQDIYLL